MNYDVSAGFSRVNITPPMGIDISGYYVKRIADGVLDELEINTIAIRKDGTTVLLMAVDTMGMSKAYIDSVKEYITAATNIPAEAIFIHSTHSHTTGRLGNGDPFTEPFGIARTRNPAYPQLHVAAYEDAGFGKRRACCSVRLLGKGRLLRGIV